MSADRSVHGSCHCGAVTFEARIDPERVVVCHCTKSQNLTGSPVYSHAAAEHPATDGLRVGCLDERASLVPHRRIWCRSTLPWSTDLGGMAAVETE